MAFNLFEMSPSFSQAASLLLEQTHYGMLTEGRITFLKKNNPEIDSSHDVLATHRDSGAIIDHFAQNADPSPKNLNTQWILSQYKKKAIRQEDAPPHPFCP